MSQHFPPEAKRDIQVFRCSQALLSESCAACVHCLVRRVQDSQMQVRTAVHESPNYIRTAIGYGEAAMSGRQRKHAPLAVSFCAAWVRPSSRLVGGNACNCHTAPVSAIPVRGLQTLLQGLTCARANQWACKVPKPGPHVHSGRKDKSGLQPVPCIHRRAL